MDNRSPPYRSPAGPYYTGSLFWEPWNDKQPQQQACAPVFTLYRDIPGLINMRTSFIQEGDPTGYKWAMKYLKSWDHWEKLCNAKWFLEALDTFRRELAIKLKSEAIERIRAIAKESENEAQALAASKYVAEYGWDKAQRGRPSKLERSAELKKLTQMAEETAEDMERIGLTVISGGKS